MAAPSIGRQVYFVAADGAIYPATVVSCDPSVTSNPDELARLAVLGMDGKGYDVLYVSAFHAEAPYAPATEGVAPGACTWRWPQSGPKAPGQIAREASAAALAQAAKNPSPEPPSVTQ